MGAQDFKKGHPAPRPTVVEIGKGDVKPLAPAGGPSYSRGGIVTTATEGEYRTPWANEHGHGKHGYSESKPDFSKKGGDARIASVRRGSTYDDAMNTLAGRSQAKPRLPLTNERVNQITRSVGRRYGEEI